MSTPTMVFKRAEKVADRPIYADQHGRHWLFYVVGNSVADTVKFSAWCVAPWPDQDGRSLAVGFYEGMVEAAKLVGGTTLRWLTPEEYAALGGTFAK